MWARVYQPVQGTERNETKLTIPPYYSKSLEPEPSCTRNAHAGPDASPNAPCKGFECGLLLQTGL
jgi:hypothetical protein